MSLETTKIRISVCRQQVLTGRKQDDSLQKSHLRVIQVKGGQGHAKVKDGVRHYAQAPVLELAPRDGHLAVQREGLALGIVANGCSQ